MGQADVLGQGRGGAGGARSAPCMGGTGQRGEQHTAPWPATPPPPPACLLRGPSGFHQVSQQSGCDIMRQSGVSGVTSCGPDVWKSPNQNDPETGSRLTFPSGPLQLPKDTPARPFRLPLPQGPPGAGSSPQPKASRGSPLLRGWGGWGSWPCRPSRCEQGHMGQRTMYDGVLNAV